MTTETILLIILIVLVIGALPSWPHSSSWGYTPTSILTVLLIIFLLWALSEHRPLFRSTHNDIHESVEEAGHDLKEAGRDTADAIRNAVR